MELHLETKHLNQLDLENEGKKRRRKKRKN